MLHLHLSLNIEGSIITPSTQERSLASSLTPSFHSYLTTTRSHKAPSSTFPLLTSSSSASLSSAAAESLIHALISPRLHYCNGILCGSPNKTLSNLMCCPHAHLRLPFQITHFVHNFHLSWLIIGCTLRNYSPPTKSYTTWTLATSSSTTLPPDATGLWTQAFLKPQGWSFETWGGQRAPAIGAPSLWNTLPTTSDRPTPGYYSNRPSKPSFSSLNSSVKLLQFSQHFMVLLLHL